MSSFRSRFSHDEDRGVGGSDLGNPRKDDLQRVGRADDFLEHRGAIHLVSQRKILAIELILERPDLRFTFLELTIEAARFDQQFLAGVQSLPFELGVAAQPLFAFRRIAAKIGHVRCASTRAISSRAVKGFTR